MSPLRILLVFTIVCVLGGMSFWHLAVSLLPSSQSQALEISFSWRGAAPKLIELEVTSKIESLISSLGEIRKIESTSKKGSGIVQVQFDEIADIQEKRRHISSKLKQIKSQLPEGVKYPVVRELRKARARMTSVIFDVSFEDDTLEKAKIIEDQIIPPIVALDLTEQVKIVNSPKFEQHIALNRQAMIGLNLSKKEVSTAYLNSNKVSSLGLFSSEKGSIETRLDYPNYKFGAIPIKKVEDKIVYLSDIARRRNLIDLNSAVWVNGRPVVRLVVSMNETGNSLVFSRQVHEAIGQISNKLEKGVSISVDPNSIDTLDSVFSDFFKRVLISMIGLLIAILLIKRSVGDLLVMLISILVSFLTSFVLIYIFRIEINLYSLIGFAVAISLLLDNILIVILSLKNKDFYNGVRIILSCSVVIIGVLSFTVFIDGDLKADLYNCALAIVVVVVASLLVAVFFVPAFIRQFSLQKNSREVISHPKTKFYERVLEGLIRRRKALIFVLVLAFGLPFYLLPSKLQGMSGVSSFYNSLMNESEFRYYLDKCTGGVIRLFTENVLDEVQIKEVEKNEYSLHLRTPNGSDPNELFNFCRKLESNLTLDYNNSKISCYHREDEYANIEISFLESSLEIKSKVWGDLLSQLSDTDGISWALFGDGNVVRSGAFSGASSNLHFDFYGYDFVKLAQIVENISSELLVDQKVFQTFVRTNKYVQVDNSEEYFLTLNKFVLSGLSMEPSALSSVLDEYSVSDNPTGFINQEDKLVPVYMDFDDTETFDLWKLQNVLLSSNNLAFPVGSIFNVEKKSVPLEIHKVNQEYFMRLNFEYLGALDSGRMFREKMLNKFKSTLPIGFSMDDKAEEIGEAGSFPFLETGCLVFLIILMISLVVFENIRKAISIICIIPFSLMGILFTFYLFEISFDQGGFLSLVIVSAITANGGILILSNFDQSINGAIGLYIKDYSTVVSLNFYTYLISILSTVLGFVPFVFFFEREIFWYALGVGVISGTFCSFLGVIILLPTILIKKSTHSTRNTLP